MSYSFTPPTTFSAAACANCAVSGDNAYQTCQVFSGMIALPDNRSACLSGRACRHVKTDRSWAHAYLIRRPRASQSQRCCFSPMISQPTHYGAVMISLLKSATERMVVLSSF